MKIQKIMKRILEMAWAATKWDVYDYISPFLIIWDLLCFWRELVEKVSQRFTSIDWKPIDSPQSKIYWSWNEKGRPKWQQLRSNNMILLYQDPYHNWFWTFLKLKTKCKLKIHMLYIPAIEKLLLQSCLQVNIPNFIRSLHYRRGIWWILSRR